MIFTDRDDTAFVDKYEDEYNFNFKEGFTLKPTASKEAIKALLVYKVKDKEMFKYKDILATYLVNEFKKTDCFKSKTEKERNEIINYLSDNLEIPENEEISYQDEDGNDITI